MIKILGSRLKQRRKQLGMSQKELGRRIGIQAPSISSIERGITLKSSYLLEIAKALDVNPDWLTGKTNDMSTHKTELKITDLLKGLSEMEKEYVLRLVRAWISIK